MTSKTERATVHSANRILPIVGLDDIAQTAKELLLKDPAMSRTALWRKLMGTFRTPKWSNSYKGIIRHEPFETFHNHDLLDIRISPEERYVSDMTVKDMLAGLPEYDRNLLILYYWHGETQANIGQQLGIAHSTVALRLNKIISKIRKQERRKGLTKRTYKRHG